MSAAAIATAPARAITAELCGCGELVPPQRVCDAFLYYCTKCGAERSVPAPRLPGFSGRVEPARLERPCRCDRKCRFCGGKRRR